MTRLTRKRDIKNITVTFIDSEGNYSIKNKQRNCLNLRLSYLVKTSKRKLEYLLITVIIYLLLNKNLLFMYCSTKKYQ